MEGAGVVHAASSRSGIVCGSNWVWRRFPTDGRWVYPNTSGDKCGSCDPHYSIRLRDRNKVGDVLILDLPGSGRLNRGRNVLFPFPKHVAMVPMHQSRYSFIFHAVSLRKRSNRLGCRNSCGQVRPKSQGIGKGAIVVGVTVTG
jgi:hypothetical protein